MTAAADLDFYIQGQMRSADIPGLSLAVSRGTELILAKGYGFANLELRVPVTPTSVFKLGSISKHFIACGIMLLAHRGLLDLDECVSVWLPNWPKAWREVTVRQLLSHMSGLVRDPAAFEPYKRIRLDEAVQATFCAPLQFRPGTGWAYSNVGYFVLAQMIEVLTNKPFDEFIQDNCFRPAGMNATRLTSSSAIIPDRCSSYLHHDKQIFNAGDLIAMRPSGAFVSSAVDLISWDIALKRGYPIPTGVQKEMENPATLLDGGSCPYGLGWEISTESGRTLRRHGGALWCFRTEFARFVEDGLTVVVLTNCREADTRAIGLDVAGHFLPDRALWLS
jgi:D-alanyl-D-alanine carboxypeptidase